ncbi:hypothetical protein GJ496_007664 [Pomphorhynchus laevis]|nr:hypothetical protein GJ496_007664 [Pomphorhynchus laevis]
MILDNVNITFLARYPQDQVDRSADVAGETLEVSEESRVDSNESIHSSFYYNESAAEAEQYIPQDKYINESSFNDQQVPNSDNNEEPLLKRNERNKKPPKYLDDYKWGRGEWAFQITSKYAYTSSEVEVTSDNLVDFSCNIGFSSDCSTYT